MNLDDFTRLKKQVERLQRDADRAAGAREQLLETLVKEFEVESIESAQKLLRRLGKEVETLEASYKEERQAFEQEYQERLEET